MKRPLGGDRGFTLIELLIALAIVGALLAIAFGGLRVAVASWQQGENRAEAHQHVRSVALILARAVSATHPYRASRGLAPEPVVLFAGTEQRMEFVTQAAPFPPSKPPTVPNPRTVPKSARARRRTVSMSKSPAGS